MRRVTPAAAVLAVALAALGPPALAQSGGALTLAQVERKYRAMSPVHIEKCDKDGDGLYTTSEMLCVRSIYQVMYLDR